MIETANFSVSLHYRNMKSGYASQTELCITFILLNMIVTFMPILWLLSEFAKNRFNKTVHNIQCLCSIDVYSSCTPSLFGRIKAL